MGTVVVGDVHGNSAALCDLLDRLIPELTRDDVTVFLGDYIDRGPDTKACIDQILQFRNSAPGPVIALMGNHEDWLLRTYRDFTRHSWVLGMEAFETIRSYSQEAERLLRVELERAGLSLVTDRVRIPYEIFFNKMPDRHLDFLRNLKTCWRTPDAFCSHGGVDPCKASPETQDTEDLLWGTDAFPVRYQGKDLIVYGHWGNAILDQSGWPAPNVSGRTIGIDTISHGVLTAIRLPDERIFQSRRYSIGI
jgi:serine/threonine protein phosphatase 1